MAYVNSVFGLRLKQSLTCGRCCKVSGWWGAGSAYHYSLTYCDPDLPLPHCFITHLQVSHVIGDHYEYVQIVPSTALRSMAAIEGGSHLSLLLLAPTP
jgi:hypothetical protein